LEERIAFALLIATLAGLSTIIGSLLGMFSQRPAPGLMALTMGFSGGVMVLVSFLELLPQAVASLGFGAALLAFFLGMVGMLLVDVLVPHHYFAEPGLPCEDEESHKNRKLLRTGIFVALGVAIHNFPEGMATFMGAMHDPKLGVVIAVAIALHNIPEGLAIAVPICAATNNRRRAFLWSVLSGLAEPVGAGLAALVLLPFLNDVVLGYTLAAVAGVMVFISLDELVPVSRSFGEQYEHLSILGVMVGMVAIALSLWLLG
jgi:ZIP family zinc transporter